MNRFYCPQLDQQSDKISITDKDEIHHLSNVLRLKEGKDITIFNGQGLEARGKIVSILPKKVHMVLDNKRHIEQALPTIALACAIPKKSKFETIIEKTTELGITEIIPLKTQRTEIHLNEDQKKKKIARYQTVGINAAKQSKRTIIPTIHPITPWKNVLTDIRKDTTVVIPSLTGKRKNILETFATIQKPTRLLFLIGPEGDFTDKEYQEAQEKGFIAVSLGANILKVETAAIATIAAAHLFYHCDK